MKRLGQFAAVGLLVALTFACGQTQTDRAGQAEKRMSTAPQNPAAPLLCSITKINAHESLYSNQQLDKLNAAAAALNVSHTVLIGHYPETFNEGTRWRRDRLDIPNNAFVLDLAERLPERFSAICLVNPSDPAVFGKIDRYVSRGAIGVQVYDFMFKRGLHSPEYDDFFQYLESNQIPLYLRTAVRKPERLRPVDRVLSKHPFLRVLIPHFLVSEDNPAHIDYLMRKHENLYFDVSYGFKKWRTRHFKEISAHIDELREIITRYADRVLFGTDVVVGKDAWKTEHYLIESYRDYAAMLECDAFRFSCTGETLRGFGFSEDILAQIYEANFERFLSKRPSCGDSQTSYLVRPSPSPETPGGEDAKVLIVPVTHVLSDTEDLRFEGGRLRLPPTVHKVLVDEALGEIDFLPAGQLQYTAKQDVLARASEDLSVIGLVSFGDLTPQVKLLSVNGLHLLDRRLRFDTKLLDSYPLSAAVQRGGLEGQNSFNAYDYFSVLISGSSLIGQGLNEVNPSFTPEALAAGIRDDIRNSDLSHLSLETSFVPNGVTDNKRFTFCTEMRHFDVLPYLGIDLVGLTGNHLLDFGEAHFEGALDLYDRYNILYYGGGRRDHIDEYAETLNLFGARAAFVGYNDISGTRGVAGPGKAGSKDLDLAQVEADIKRLSRDNDAVIVDFQAGNEFSSEPTYFQRRLAAACAEWGADAVTFLHSHVIKGFEQFGKTTAFYGPGNFFFFHPSKKSDTRHAYAIRYYFSRNRLIQFELVPIAISDHDVQRWDRNALMDRLRSIQTRRNTKSPLHDIYAVDLGETFVAAGFAARFATHFNVHGLKIPAARVAPMAEARHAAPEERGPVFIDPTSFLIDGARKPLERPSVHVLFSFPSIEALNAFKDAVQVDPQKARDLFTRHADKIVFGGRVFFSRGCRSRGGRYFFAYRLMTTYRNLLERAAFDWPDWSYCAREWGYDYGKETPIRGLDLSDEVLAKIYRANAERLLPNQPPELSN